MKNIQIVSILIFLCVSVVYASVVTILDQKVTPYLVRVGEPVIVSCNVSHPGGLQAIKTVAARLSTKQLNTSYPNLYDDGTHGDEIAGDGIYSLKITAPTKSGDADIVFTAVDTDNNETESEPVVLFVL
nr:choice-of-anchor X domain-containing protein [uncultured Desulfobulbus sp.]